MKTRFILIFVLFSYLPLRGQIASTHPNYIWAAKEFSKDQAIFNSKSYLFREILGTSTEVLNFEIEALAAASSGELTTLMYDCKAKKIGGMVLGFYGNYWNQQGVLYQGFAFKNFTREQAEDFLAKVQAAIDANSKYLRSDPNSNNIVFRYDDLDILIWSSPTQGITIRLFWNGFDSTWEHVAFERSKRRYEKKLKG